MNNKPFRPVSSFGSLYDHSSRLIHDMRNHQRAYSASVVPSQMTFGVIAVGSTSSAQTATITNTGYRALPILSVIGVGDYLISDSAPAVLQAGHSFEIIVQFKPTHNGLATGGVYINTGDAAGSEFIAFNGFGSGSGSGGGLPVISIMPGSVIEVTDGGGGGGESVTIVPSTFSFGSIDVGDESTNRTFTVTNSTALDVTVTSVTVPTGFTLVGTYAGETIAPMGSLAVQVKFTPTAQSNYTGNISVVTSGGTVNTSITGTGVPVVVLERLRTLGNQIVKVSDNTPVVLKSVNWFGAEGLNHTPHGTWLVRYTDIIHDIKSMGFNCIRLPFSGDTFNATPPPTAFDFDINPEFEGLTALQVLDIIINYCGEQGLYVVLDHHRRTAGAGADGSPTSGTYTEANWINTWSQMATRYKDNLAVVGADLHNEPHDLTWTAWATLAETCGNAVNAIAPNWLIFVEGVGSYNDASYWWGGQLAGVRDRPVVLTTPNRLVYSPHEYGQSVASQQWLAQDGQPLPADWPNNLYTKWADNWSFIFYENIAPVWIGEMGGFFGVDGSGNLTKPHGAYETVWMTELIKHITGKETPTSEGTGSSMSWAFWSYNPNSGDTGGLVQDNWITHQQVKLDILEPALNFTGA